MKKLSLLVLSVITLSLVGCGHTPPPPCDASMNYKTGYQKASLSPCGPMRPINKDMNQYQHKVTL